MMFLALNPEDTKAIHTNFTTNAGINKTLIQYLVTICCVLK